MSAAVSAIESTDEGFDFTALIDELRCHSNESLRATVREARCERERWRLRELAATRVLDERDALGAMPDATVSARTARSTVEVARELESMPAIAAAVHDGKLSWDQVQPLVEVATPGTDREWAERAQRLSPGDLQRMARGAQRVSAAEDEARHAARFVRTWRDQQQGMAAGRWALPDVDGVLVDKVLEHMAERMRPAKGMPWDSLAHRKADALVKLARSYANAEPTGRFRIEIVNIVDPSATAVGPQVDGIPIATETLLALLPQAKVRECTVDETGVPRTTKKPRAPLPADLERHIRRRDRTCRTPGCEESRNLEIHHCDPITSFGENHDPRRLAAVCDHDHHLYEPHGPYRLIGNAEEPDGLRLVHRDDLPPDELPPDGQPRDGPSP